MCLEGVQNVNRQRPNLSSCRQTACKLSVILQKDWFGSLYSRRRLRKRWTRGRRRCVLSLDANGGVGRGFSLSFDQVP